MGEEGRRTGITPLRHKDGSTVVIRFETKAVEIAGVTLYVWVAFARRVIAGATTPQEAAARVKTNRTVTERELEILQLLADGLENDEIATQLFISVETVKSHVRRLLQKLEARSRTHAVAVAFRTNLVD
jgi:DNA-binding NarL/FixJ family response regulator